MKLDKSRKRIAKKVKMGFQGFPTIEIEYFGPNKDLATEVHLKFMLEESANLQTEIFSTEADIREDETIQSVIVKMIERAGAKTVTLNEGVEIKS